MRYLDNLLEGESVELIPLGEIAELKRGTSITKKSSTEGIYPVISGGQHPAYYIDQFNRSGATITVAGSGAYAGFVMYWNKPIFVGDAFSIKTDEKHVLLRYVYHFLLNIQDKIYDLKSGGGVPHVYAKDVACFQVPIPCPNNPQKSLEIQRKLVEILDKFTELEAELEAELDCRKRQYKYYRDKLLSFDMLIGGGNLLNNAGWIPLEMVGEIRMCKRVLKEQTSAFPEVPFYKIGTFGKEPDAYISRKLFNEYKSKYNYPKVGEILISASGTIGRAVVFDGQEAYFQDSNIVWIENDESRVLNKYLFYCYQIVKWKISEGGTISRLYNDNLKKTLIPVPYPNDRIKSLEAQRHIVSMLDKFDTLTSSISDGLPKEIELRRKQYEYYRNQLLSFPDKIIA
jgi:type I restriction enzyme S subunit